ncbi:MAG: peroxiredoxin [Thermoanaerobaculia bacterium]
MRHVLCILTLSFLLAAPLGAGTVPAAGEPAPEFTLVNDQGEEASLADYRGKWVVLYFYPKDFTSGCTLEAHNFQRDLAKYEERDAVILGVSVDSAESHKEFCAKEGLAFRLLSDPEAKVSGAYGSLAEYQGKTYSARNTFLIDPEGKVARVFEKVKPATHSEEVLAALDELRAD